MNCNHISFVFRLNLKTRGGKTIIYEFHLYRDDEFLVEAKII